MPDITHVPNAIQDPLFLIFLHTQCVSFLLQLILTDGYRYIISLDQFFAFTELLVSGMKGQKVE